VQWSAGVSFCNEGQGYHLKKQVIEGQQVFVDAALFAAVLLAKLNSNWYSIVYQNAAS
jgi:hypothetical protein